MGPCSNKNPNPNYPTDWRGFGPSIVRLPATSCQEQAAFGVCHRQVVKTSPMLHAQATPPPPPSRTLPFPPSAVNETEWIVSQCCSAKMTQVLGLLLTSQASWLAGAIPNSKMHTSNMNPTLSTDHRIRLLAAQKSSDTRFWGPISRLRPRAEDSETHAAATVRLRRGA